MLLWYQNLVDALLCSSPSVFPSAAALIVAVGDGGLCRTEDVTQAYLSHYWMHETTYEWAWTLWQQRHLWSRRRSSCHHVWWQRRDQETECRVEKGLPLDWVDAYSDYRKWELTQVPPVAPSQKLDTTDGTALAYDKANTPFDTRLLRSRRTPSNK